MVGQLRRVPHDFKDGEAALNEAENAGNSSANALTSHAQLGRHVLVTVSPESDGGWKPLIETADSTYRFGLIQGLVNPFIEAKIEDDKKITSIGQTVSLIPMPQENHVPIGPWFPKAEITPSITSARQPLRRLSMTGLPEDFQSVAIDWNGLQDDPIGLTRARVKQQISYLNAMLGQYNAMKSDVSPEHQPILHDFVTRNERLVLDYQAVAEKLAGVDTAQEAIRLEGSVNAIDALKHSVPESTDLLGYLPKDDKRSAFTAFVGAGQGQPGQIAVTITQAKDPAACFAAVVAWLKKQGATDFKLGYYQVRQSE